MIFDFFRKDKQQVPPPKLFSSRKEEPDSLRTQDTVEISQKSSASRATSLAPNQPKGLCIAGIPIELKADPPFKEYHHYSNDEYNDLGYRRVPPTGGSWD